MFDYDDEFYLQPRTLRHPDRKSLSELDSPFIYVYHDRGGHLPYDCPFEDYEDMRAFFDTHRDRRSLRRMYEQSVGDSGRRFVELLDELRDRGKLEDTLVVYVSDHGELLGEYGNLFTHAVPMVPELVEIPMVFTGAGLPRDKQYDALLSGIDLAPTVLGALEQTIPNEADGTDLWNERPDEDRLVRSEVWKQTQYEYLQSYVAGSVWDQDGGYVCHRESRLHRLVYSLGVHLAKGPHAPLARTLSPKNYYRLLHAHLPATLEYGTPNFNADEARQVLPPFERAPNRVKNETDRERLRSLGYLE
ncbi:sulfatase-like hydrolase/transferase [Halorussus sp. AFM4]|uniref:sulfatase-like hydrolase/transferase n=1 Tax=Halorussus sp. AFM4 TaxID=3421651 RepID=UPI003EB7BC3A